MHDPIFQIALPPALCASHLIYIQHQTIRATSRETHTSRQQESHLPCQTEPKPDVACSYPHHSLSHQARHRHHLRSTALRHLQ